MKIILAQTYGFCFGVRRAIEIAQNSKKTSVGKATQGPRPGLFVLKEIVHNPQVVKKLAAKGVKSVKSLEEVPQGATIIFSAHGVSPQIFQQARQKGLKIIDATCPLVSKVHALVKKLARGDYQIFYLGDPQHDEAVGVLQEAPGKIIPIPTERTQSYLAKISIKNPTKLAVITQTTLSLQETQATIKFLVGKFPQILVYNTICQATTERQQAVSDLAQKVEVIVVVGGKGSANTKRLWGVACNLGKRAYWIETVKDLEKSWFSQVKKVGITAGASTPDWVTKEVIQKIKNW